MFSKSVAFAFCLFAAFALLTANAVVIENDKRDLGGIINSLTSDAGSVFSQATSLGGSLVTDATSLAEGVATIATSIGGKAATVITSAGGAAITLAESGAGVVTTFAGSVYTAATGEIASATNSNNAALGLQAWSPSAPLTGGLATVLVSMVFGAWVAL